MYFKPYVKPNYELKAKVLTENVKELKAYRSYQFNGWRLSKIESNYEDFGELPNFDVEYAIQQFNDAHETLIHTDKEIVDECRRLNTSLYQTRCRVKRRIEKMLASEMPCYFITMTFKNETLDNTNRLTRRQKIFRTLKHLCIDYVANIDYGDKNGREHYHAVACTLNPNFYKMLKSIYDYGFINVKPINTDEADKTRLAKYITKLTSHAIKSTNKRCCIIYCRNSLLRA